MARWNNILEQEMNEWAHREFLCTPYMQAQGKFKWCRLSPSPDMVVKCQVEKVFPVHLFLCGYAVRYIPVHMPDQNLE